MAAIRAAELTSRAAGALPGCRPPGRSSAGRRRPRRPACHRIVASKASRQDPPSAAEPTDTVSKRPRGKIDITTLCLEDLPPGEAGGLMGPELTRLLHDKAQELGLDSYIDPPSGYSVLTAANLARRPCCQGGCRHCPYGFKLS